MVVSAAVAVVLVITAVVVLVLVDRLRVRRAFTANKWRIQVTNVSFTELNQFTVRELPEEFSHCK